LLLILLINCYADSCTKHPVVIVPGLMASILEAKLEIPKDVEFCDRKLDCPRNKDWFRLWVDLADGIPYMNECYLSYLKCVYNESTHLMNNIEGVTIVPPDFGSTYAVDYICPTIIAKQFSKAFHEIIKGLENIGYKDGYDLLGAPYDWRYYHHDDYLANVKQLILTAYENTQQKVVLLSHSMGGLTTYVLLDYLGKEFCDKYILRWIAMSTPWIGTNVANHVVFNGYALGYPVSKKLIKQVTRTFESVVMMTPNERYWDKDDVLVTTNNGNEKYHVDRELDLLNTLEPLNKIAEEAYTNSLNPYFDKHNTKVPFDVEMHCAYTSGLETVKTINYEQELESDYNIEYGDGDEEVPLASLTFCERMTNNVTYLGKYNHQAMLSKKEIVDYLKNLACN